MATKGWGDGTSDLITYTESGNGDGSIGISSSENQTGVTRSSSLTITPSGVNPLTINLSQPSSVNIDGKYVMVSVSGRETWNSSNWGSSLAAALSTYHAYYDTAMSISGRYQYVCQADSSNSYIYRSSNYGASWTVVGTSAKRVNISCSDDGRYVLTGVNAGGGYIQVSSDYGVTWSNVGTVGYYVGAKVSASGQYMIIGHDSSYGTPPSAFEVSSDYGQTWTHAGSVTGRWLSTCMSKSGQYMYGASYGGGVYVSSNYGVTWTLHSDSMTHYSISCSDSGKYVICGDLSTNMSGILVSSNYGASFTSKSISSRLSRSSVSGTGQYCLMCGYNGSIYVSSDYGRNWAAKGDVDAYWCTNMSYSGQYMYVAANGGSNSFYKSSDYGQTWTQITGPYGACSSISVSRVS